MRQLIAALLLGCGVTVAAGNPDAAAVRVWQAVVQIPTYTEGPANPNPPFDLFAFGRFNYPYPIRDNLTTRREVVTWRSLHLENEYLRLTVLPDLGGHIYSCLDKRSNREMFYANSAIKKALIGYRGAWAALGVEFNFPVSHNWMSMSPVDFATATRPDGSGSIWVGNVDQVYGSQWRVELRLEPGRALLQQRVDLYNASDVRHRYYWWNNAAVQVWDDSRLVYPTELMATHGFTRIQPWPVDGRGRDLSLIRNQTDGPVSLFTHGTREGFVGVYHPRTNSGTVHVASHAELPTHKVWSWGNDREAAAWRTALSDDDSAYVELQAGLFRNQETYAFLEPQESVQFVEHWLPVRDLGGITRANTDGVLKMDRSEDVPSRVQLALDVTRDLPGARITVSAGSVSLIDTTVSLSPRDVWRGEVDAAPGDRVTFELVDADGQLVLRHTEHVFDRLPATGAHVGAQPDLRRSATGGGVANIIEAGRTDELEGRRLAAMARYQSGLAQHRQSLALLKAAGRLAVALGWAEAKRGGSSSPTEWLAAAHARHTTDAEVSYYLGVALMAAGRAPEARQHLEAAHRFRDTRAAAGLQLARLLAKEGDAGAALRQIQAIGAESARAPVIGALEVALLRSVGRDADARSRAHYWRTIDPTSSMLRYELTLLGEPDPALWPHLAADANRVLDVVDRYLEIGRYTDALGLLEHGYPRLETPMREPGAVAPDDSALVVYYRAYARARAGGDPAADYAKAQARPLTYVFPNRRSSYAVLEAALQANRNDASARFLLGSLYLASGLVEPAIEAWQIVRRARPDMPTLHRNLGLALLHGPGDHAGARSVLEEGTTADPANVEVYLAFDGVLSAAHATARERVDGLRRFPASSNMPPALVFKLALALAEAGDREAAEQLFHDRFFPREEGGTSVRTVYAQVRLTSAMEAAGRGDCATSLGLLDSLAQEQPALDFTRGGLSDALASPMMAQQVAAIERTCGRRASARARWDRLARALSADASPTTLAVAAAAQRRLGRVLSAAQRARLQKALDAATSTLESAGTSNPGLTEYARASLLNALGRTADAQRSFRRVFAYPDRGLSQALARAAMRSPVPAGVQ